MSSSPGPYLDPVQPRGSDWRATDKTAMLSEIKRSLESCGLDVEIGKTLRGRSGANHVFDAALLVGGHPVLMDLRIAAEDAVELSEILPTYVKSLDARTKSVVIVAIPEASAEARKAAAAFGIELVEGADLPQILSTLATTLGRLTI